MRIAMLGHKRVPSREGGVEIVVEELGARMVALGHQVTCYNRKGHHVSGRAFNAKRNASYRGLELKWVPTIDRRGFAAMSASFFGALFAAFGKYDIVHFHAEGPCAMLWLPKLLGKRCIATIHGLDHMRSKWGRFAKAYIMLGEKCAVKLADEIIVLNKSNQRYFQERYKRDTIFIPNGVNRPRNMEADQIRSRFDLEKNEYILYLGRIVPEKGLEYLIKAFRKVKTGKKLVIAGGASDSEEYYRHITKLAKGDKRILFTNFVQDRTLEELYSNAYVFVLPSDIEGMSISLMEAMSYGNCCLVSDIPENADLVGKMGFTFRKSDVDDLAIKLQLLIKDPEIVENYRAASVNISATYNWDEITRETLQVYAKQKLANENTVC